MTYIIYVQCTYVGLCVYYQETYNGRFYVSHKRPDTEENLKENLEDICDEIYN